MDFFTQISVNFCFVTTCRRFASPTLFLHQKQSFFYHGRNQIPVASHQVVRACLAVVRRGRRAWNADRAAVAMVHGAVFDGVGATGRVRPRWTPAVGDAVFGNAVFGNFGDGVADLFWGRTDWVEEVFL